ncbi:MAG: glutamine--fructose-6-phosphate transaminase (isomerizing) [Chloroflexota bacterium]|nr:glutamine--fructose-6-phosphate transaminase (isomerizing) [Chloroflexota bacterium]
MCGIVGFIGHGQAAPVMLSALKRLEYRGYDSAGMALISNGTIAWGKDTGKLDEVEARQSLSGLAGSVGIGHVRWATHGAVTQGNAHPHLDCTQRIAVVHNGIIENYIQLRRRLGHRHDLVSDTDTETIAHLIEEYVEEGASLEKAVFQTVKELRGSYAILAISAREPHKIVAARKDSPLVVGIGERGNYLASDALSFLEDTNKVIFVEDGEVVSLSDDGVAIIDSGGIEVYREPQEINWRWDQATKLGYDFFMHKEIMEQPQAVRCALMQDRHQMMEMAMEILRAREVVLTGCGTSRHAALIGRYLFSRLGGKFTDVIMGSEFHHFSDSMDRNTLVLAVSQSGETADVLEGVKRAKESGATIFSLVNVVGSSLARVSDQAVYLNCGPEIGVAATKSFVSQLAILYILAYAMTNRLREGVRMVRAVSPLIEKNCLVNGDMMMGLAQRLRDEDHVYYIARGINFAVASEAALKLKEIAYTHAEGMPAGELKHGTLALIERGTPVVAICPADYTFEETMSNIAEAKARGAFVIGVSDREDGLFDEWIRIPPVDEVFYPLVSIVPLQLLAYHAAVARGLDPDKPRNLAKSVTVR